jgi:hypothetical protein
MNRFFTYQLWLQFRDNPLLSHFDYFMRIDADTFLVRQLSHHPPRLCYSCIFLCTILGYRLMYSRCTYPVLEIVYAYMLVVYVAFKVFALTTTNTLDIN